MTLSWPGIFTLLPGRGLWVGWILSLVIFPARLFPAGTPADYREDPLSDRWRWHRVETLDGVKTALVQVASQDLVYFAVGGTGLISFDGLTSTALAPPDDPLFEAITSLFVSSRGDLYVTARKATFRLSKGSWRRVASVGRGIRASRVFAESEDGIIWAAVDGGILRVHPAGDVAVLPFPERLLALCLGPLDRSLWMTGHQGELWEWPLPDGTSAPDRSARKVQAGTDHDVASASLLRAQDGRIWSINSDLRLPVSVFDPQTNTWEQVNLSGLGGDNRNFAISEGENGSIWISSRGALHVRQGEDWQIFRSPDYTVPGTVFHIAHLPDQSVLLVDTGGSVLHLDCGRQSGRSFAGLHYQASTAEGHDLFISAGSQIVLRSDEQELRRHEPHITGVDTPVAARVLRDGRWLVVGSNQGGAAAAISDGVTWRHYPLPSLALSISHLGVLERANGEIWLGCAQEPREFTGITGGLAILRPMPDGTFTVELRLPPVVPFRNWSLRESPKGDVVVGGMGLVSMTDRGYRALPAPPVLQNKWIDQIAFDREGWIWAAAWSDGVFRQTAQGWEGGPASNRAFEYPASFILPLRSGDMVMATPKGFFRYDSGRWAPWLAGTEGLYRGSGEMIEGRQQAVWVNRTHVDWYYRGQRTEPYPREKLAGFRTTEWRHTSAPPDTRWSRPPVEETKDTVLSFAWEGVDAWSKTPRQWLEYSHRIDQGAWSVFSPAVETTINGLGNGLHVIEVRARDSDGNVDPVPARAVFSIVLPLWRQAWFIGLIAGVVLVFAGLVTIVIRQRIRHVLEIERVKLRFFTNISHEIKTPLSLILGPVEELQQHVQDPQQRQYLSLIKVNSERLLVLVNQLLDFRKLQLGKLASHPERSDFLSFIRQCTGDFESSAKEHGVTLSVESPLPALVFRFDAELFHKVVTNLVSNAVKYSPVNGVIRVHVARQAGGGNQGLLEVIDQGPGIPLEEQQRIFELFYRSPNQPGRPEGSGVGLALVKELMEAIGGRIEVESPVEDGHGSCFRAVFPLVGEEPPPETTVVEPAADATEENPPAEKELVLVIEDTPALRQFLTDALSGRFRVHSAADVTAGLEQARTLIPDLIVSDVMLGDGDGFAVCQKLKQDPHTSHIPVILLTVLRSDEHRQKAFESGADDFITKPVSTRLLQLKIQNLLATQRRNRERIQKQFCDDHRISGLADADQAFIDQVNAIIDERMGDEQFEVNALARKLGFSRSAFYRKFTGLTDVSPAAFIRTRRLRRAAEWLAAGTKNVTEAAFAAGFSDSGYFSRVFKEEFKCLPSTFTRNHSTRIAPESAAAGPSRPPGE